MVQYNVSIIIETNVIYTKYRFFVLLFFSLLSLLKPKQVGPTKFTAILNFHVDGIQYNFDLTILDQLYMCKKI